MGYELHGMPQGDGEDIASPWVSALDHPSHLQFVGCSWVCFAERRVVQRVLEDNLDVAEDCDLAVDVSEPILSIFLHQNSTRTVFQAVDQVDPVHVVDSEGAVEHRGA